MSSPVIEAKDVGARFGRVWVLRKLNLVVEQGEVLALVGGSGSGKTTLLRQISGLLRPTHGEMRVFGEPLFSGDAGADRRLRQRFGVMFQQGALFSAFNVFDNVALPLRDSAPCPKILFAKSSWSSWRWWNFCQGTRESCLRNCPAA